MNEMLFDFDVSIFYARLAAVLILTAIAVAGDLKSYKISNRLVMSGLVCAIALLIYETMHTGRCAAYLKGLIVTFVILFVVYILKAVGAGDVKLFSVLGFIAGYDAIIRIVVFTFISAAVIGIAGIITGILKKRTIGPCKLGGIKKLQDINVENRFFTDRVCNLSNVEMNLKSDEGIEFKMHVFHFTIAIALGEVLYMAELIYHSLV